MAISTRPKRRRGLGRPFASGNPGRPKGAVNKASRDIKARAREILEDPEYLVALKARINKGNAQQVEALLFHYGYGKPRDIVQIEGGAVPLPLVVKLTGGDE